MKILKLLIICISLFFATSCASGYRNIDPAGHQYGSVDVAQGVTLQYKYEVLRKKYAKKEKKKGVRVVAFKIINNSDQDYVFGTDLDLKYSNGAKLRVLSQERLFRELKQHPATHLLYLLLTPVNLTVTTNNSSNSTPVGLALGPGLAAGNLITASSANSKFKREIAAYDLTGRVIAKGETAFGIMGLDASTPEALKLDFR
jgi:hypothetical protein